MSESLRVLVHRIEKVTFRLKKPLEVTLLSAMLALQSLLGLVGLFDALNLTYYPTIYGLTMTKTFNLGFNLTPLIFLFSVVASAFLIESSRYLHVLLSAFSSAFLIFFFGLEVSAIAFSILITVVSLVVFRNLHDYALWVLALAAGFESLAFSHWVIFKPLGIPSPTVWIADLELELFFVVAPLAPFVALSILFMWVMKPPTRLIARFYGKARNHSSDDTSGGGRSFAFPLNHSVLLACAIVLAAVSAVYPHIPNINPKGSPVGKDVPNYVDMMKEIGETPYKAFFVAGGSRPLSLLFIYGFGRALGLGVGEAVKLSPFLLNPLLAASMYLVVFEATDNKLLASLSSLFTTLGFMVTIGMYSHFLADMLGLCLTFTALGCLFKASRTGSLPILGLACILGSLVVFTHPWTFVQYYAGVALTLPFLVFRCLKKKKFERGLVYTFIYLAFTGFVDVSKGFFLGMGGYSAATSMAEHTVHISDFWNSNTYCFRYLYGGLLSNVLLLGVAAAGAYFLSHRDHFQLFLTLLSVASSVYYPFADGTAQSRLLYNVPFGVLAAFATFNLLRNSKIPEKIRISAFIFLMVYMLVYLFRSLANLVFMLP